MSNTIFWPLVTAGLFITMVASTYLIDVQTLFVRIPDPTSEAGMFVFIAAAVIIGFFLSLQEMAKRE